MLISPLLGVLSVGASEMARNNALPVHAAGKPFSDYCSQNKKAIRTKIDASVSLL